MKVEKKRAFQQIVITIETEKECEELVGVFHKVHGSEIAETLYRKLSSEIGGPMAGLFHGNLERN